MDDYDDYDDGGMTTADTFTDEEVREMDAHDEAVEDELDDARNAAEAQER